MVDERALEINKIYLERYLSDQTTILKYGLLGLFAVFLTYLSGNLDKIEATGLEMAVILLTVIFFLVSRRKEKEILDDMRS